MLFVAVAWPSHGQVFQELHALTCVWDDVTGLDCTREGFWPEGALVQGKDGNFYGTTAAGGRWGCGTIFRITPHGDFTTLAHFDGTNGCSPYGALLQAADGNLYGSTMYGWGRGTFFRMTVDGTITNYGTSSPIYPLGDLVEGPDRKMYGTSQEGGGAYCHGTIFRFSTNGAFETLHWFCGADGLYPSGGLLLASDGNFYGVTAGGGADGYGTIYRITTNGDFTTMVSFYQGSGNAVWPRGKLVEYTNGSFFGGAGGGWDTIFKYTPGGAPTTFARFAGAPVGSMVRWDDGYLYGCTYDGGWSFNGGTLFRLDPTHGCTNQIWAPCGNFTQLFLFGETAPGWHPYAGLTRGQDGNLYGTTAEGGPNGAGNIFRIIMPGNECTLTCPADITVGNDPGRCGAVVNFGPPLTTNCAGYVITSVPPSGSFFAVGTNTVQWTALDSASGQLTNTCAFQIIVRDCEPPVIHEISSSPASLWPPNHKMQPVTLRVNAIDNCGVARSRIISVSSNDGSTADWQMTGDLALSLRAERSGRTGARVYSITVECVDDSGNSVTAVTKVGVPH